MMARLLTSVALCALLGAAAVHAAEADPWQGLRSEAPTAPKPAPAPKTGASQAPAVPLPPRRPAEASLAAGGSGPASTRPASATTATVPANRTAPAPVGLAAPARPPAMPAVPDAAPNPAPGGSELAFAPDAGQATAAPDISAAPAASVSAGTVPATASPAQMRMTAASADFAPLPPTRPKGGIPARAVAPAPVIMPVLTGGPDAPPAGDTAPVRPGTASPGADGTPAGAATAAHGETQGAAPAATPHGAANEAGETPSAPAVQPVARVRKLQRLQDAIAGGYAEGVALQRALITETDAAFAAADPLVWQDAANARALVIYSLSGGAPDVLRAIVNGEPKPNIDPHLLTGSLLYLEGREDAALRELGEVDARKLPNALAGQVALAQAALTVRSDPAKSASLLELARLFLPGTLVDEAALRRAVLVAAQAGDMETFQRLTAQYFSRFRHSAYAGNFRQRFAAALTRMAPLATPDGLARLDALLAPLDDEARRDTFLQMARAAIVEGKTALAAACARRALTLAPQASRDAERAQVYISAAEAASAERYQSAARALGNIDRNRLDPSDQALLDAARSTADVVLRADQALAPASSTSASPPATNAALSGTVPPAAAGADTPRAPSPASPAALASATARGTAATAPPAVISRAELKLQQVDALLKDAPR